MRGRVDIGAARIRPDLLQADWSNALLSHTYLLDSGSWPTSRSEVAVSSVMLDKLNSAVGDEFTLARPAATVRIVGTFTQRDGFNAKSVAVHTSFDITNVESSFELFVDVGSAGDPAVAVLARQGTSPLDQRSWFPVRTFLATAGKGGFESRDQRNAIAALQTVTVIALFLLGTIVTAAFSVGARRQLRQLGLVAANGGDPRQIGRAITLQGTLTALIGVIVGLALGVVGLVATSPYWNRWANLLLPGVDWSAIDLLIAGLLAVLAGTITAGLPARATACGSGAECPGRPSSIAPSNSPDADRRVRVHR